MFRLVSAARQANARINKMASRATGVSAPQMFFDGSKDKYDLWEARFLSHLHILKLKETILHEATGNCTMLLAEDMKKNADCYDELIRLIDHKSQSLISDAAKDGRKALKILRKNYSGKRQALIINLYTSLTKLRMTDKETVVDYLLRAENIINSLKDAGEAMSDELIIGVILGGLPDSFEPLSVHVNQNGDTVTITDIKKRLCEEAQIIKTSQVANSVMKANVTQGTETPFNSQKENDTTVTCWKCGMKGPKARRCFQMFGGHCNNCTQQQPPYKEKGEEDGDQTHPFNVKHAKNEQSLNNIKLDRIMVDAGATLHIVNDFAKFKSFDDSFQADTHSVRLADGTKCEGIAQRKGTAVVYLLDNAGQHRRAELQDALYISSYPHNIFSVARATNGGATITFQKGDSHMVTKDGSRFDISESRNLFYLPTVMKNVDKCEVSHNMQTWHEILGHCDYEDLKKLQGVVKGMRIAGSAVKPTRLCEVCMQRKIPQVRSGEPGQEADKPLELVRTDLMGPMSTPSIEGYRYAQSFTDDYSGMIMVYFLRSKSDAVRTTRRFLADTVPYGEVKCICSNSGTEFASRDFQALLTKYRIRHKTSAAFSTHQNDTAERGWQTLYDMSTSLLLESKLPDVLWNYAVQTSAYVRNRWYCRHMRKTPYELFTGKQPNMSKLQKFGSVCFTSEQERDNTDSGSEQGVFVGYDKYSPAYLVYYPDINRVQKHRLVKFAVKTSVEEEMPTPESYSECGCEGVATRDVNDFDDENVLGQVCKLQTVSEDIQPNRATETVSQRYPPRKRKRPAHLQDYEVGLEPCIDFCNKAFCEFPQTCHEAISTKMQWKDDMDEEM